MNLDDIGDDPLVERVARILHAADPPDPDPFEQSLTAYRANPNGIFDMALWARCALDDDATAAGLTPEQRKDLRTFLRITRAFIVAP